MLAARACPLRWPAPASYKSTLVLENQARRTPTFQKHVVVVAKTILFAEAVVARRSCLAAALARACLLHISSIFKKTHGRHRHVTNTLFFLKKKNCLRRLSLLAARAYPLRWPVLVLYRSTLV